MLIIFSLGAVIGVQDVAGNVVEDKVRLRLAQLHRHEPLPVVDELDLVRGGLELACPCLGPAATRQELKMAAIFFGSQHKNQCKKTSRVQLLDPCRSPDHVYCSMYPHLSLLLMRCRQWSWPFTYMSTPWACVLFRSMVMKRK